jgi:hypothetical protein
MKTNIESLDYFEKFESKDDTASLGDFSSFGDWYHEAKTKNVKFREWIVTPENDICWIGKNNSEYWIEEGKLMQQNWIAQIIKKHGYDVEAFVKAYYFALERKGLDLYKLNYSN